MNFRKFLIITNHLLLVNIFLVIMYGQNCYFILARWKECSFIILLDLREMDFGIWGESVSEQHLQSVLQML